MIATIQRSQVSEVFVDWLDCTYSPLNNPVPDIEKLLQSCGASVERPAFGSKEKTVWMFDVGKVHISENSQWVRVSSSGQSLESLRTKKCLEQYVNVLASSPNKVTRIDVAVDVSSDAPPLIKELRRLYPHNCKLSRKPVKTRSILTTRGDGVETGSIYFGDRSKADVTAVCYDKQEEAWCRRDEMIEPTTRFELRVKSGVRPTLADALDPTPLFWHYAGHSLIPTPEGVQKWIAGRGYQPWVNSWVPPTPATTMIERVNNSPELLALAKLAVECGPNGRDMLQSLISSRIDSHVDRLTEQARASEHSRKEVTTPAECSEASSSPNPL